LVGVMSGTSADGADAVVAEFNERDGDRPNGMRLLGCAGIDYSPQLRAEIMALNSPCDNELARSQELGVALSRIYAEAALAAIRDAGLEPGDISACAVHGQTLRHQPDKGYSLQAVSLPLLAELLGVAVIGDFRGRDLAAGGQGAPLACGFHDWYFRDRPCAVLNLGGFANLTILYDNNPPLGFDCGPANALLDAWAEKHLGAAYDEDGRWAAGGECQASLLARLQGHEFFLRPPPKSTGRDDFHLDWLMAQGAGDHTTQDVQATLLALSTWCVAKELARFEEVKKVYACGGGVHNQALMRELADAFDGASLQTSDQVGAPARWMEAIAFAWLGWRQVKGLPGNLPSVTGACGERVLGGYYFA